MAANASEISDQIDALRWAIRVSRIEQVFTWMGMHRSAREYRHEINRQTLMQYEAVIDVLFHLKKQEVCLIRSLVVTLSLISRILNLIFESLVDEQREKVDFHQKRLALHLTGSEWLAAFKKVQQLDEAIRSERQKIFALQEKFEKKIKSHNACVQRLTEKIQRMDNNQ